jgi:peptidoglycan-N-acetylglucosamine deacetylase
MDNALIIDLEHWYCSEFLTPYLPMDRPDQVPESVKPILDLLDQHDVKATFAVLGSVAEAHPELIADIAARGHEIASHAYSHKTLYELGPDAFEAEVIRSVELLETITGRRPIGFRAPSFSINNSTRWALEVLERHGFRYDASVFPVKTMLYGVPEAPLGMYRPSRDDIARHDPGRKIIEFPMTVLKGPRNLPIAGGFYLRALPLWFLETGFRAVHQSRPSILYLHPWETYQDTPRLNVPAFSRFVTYYGIGSSLRKLEALLDTFRYRPVCEVISRYYDGRITLPEPAAGDAQAGYAEALFTKVPAKALGL